MMPRRAGPFEWMWPVTPTAARWSNTTSRTGETVQTMFDLVTSDVTRQDQEVVELPLLLPRWQAVELEAAARRRGMTTGQMIRRVIGDMLASQKTLAKS